MITEMIPGEMAVRGLWALLRMVLDLVALGI